MQAVQLFHHQKQKEGGAFNYAEKVLQVVPCSYRTQRKQEIGQLSLGGGVSSNGKTLVSKTRYPGSNPGTPARNKKVLFGGLLVKGDWVILLPNQCQMVF